jgi:adenylate cyclase
MLIRGPDDDVEATWLLGAAEALRAEIGAPRFPPTEAALAEALAPARQRTSVEVLDRAAEAGSVADLTDSADRANSALHPSPEPVSPG